MWYDVAKIGNWKDQLEVEQGLTWLGGGQSSTLREMFGVSLWEWWEKGQCAGEAVYEGIQVQSQAGPASLAQVSYAGGWNA